MESASFRKALRAGRRGGKTRVVWFCGMVGHGPEGHHAFTRPDGTVDEWDGPLHRGIAQGRDVVWVAPDHTQGRILWNEEVRPRLGACDLVDLNSTLRYATFPDGTRFWFASGEAIEAIRGAGNRLGGVIVDEAAKMDLGYALRGVIMPALLDNRGWLLLASTTNAGKDGDPEWPSGPSYFNRLCEVINGAPKEEMGFGEDFDASQWEEFYFTAYDNPKIAPESIRELETLYPAGSVDREQEVYARLGATPAGLAFPEWRDDLIVTGKDFLAPPSWYAELGGDWGYGSPGWAGLHRFGPNGRVHLAVELLFNGQGKGGWKEPNQPPYEIGKRIGRMLLECGQPLPRRIVFDIPDDLKDGRGGMWHESIKDEMERGLKEVLRDAMPPFERQDKGMDSESSVRGGSRAARKLKLHDLIRYTALPNGDVPPWGMPLLSVHPSCTFFLRTVPRLPLDPANADDVDTSAVDHAYDGATGLLISRPKHAAPPKRKDPPDTHRTPKPPTPGYEPRYSGFRG